MTEDDIYWSSSFYVESMKFQVVALLHQKTKTLIAGPPAHVADKQAPYAFLV